MTVQIPVAHVDRMLTAARTAALILTHVEDLDAHVDLNSVTRALRRCVADDTQGHVHVPMAAAALAVEQWQAAARCMELRVRAPDGGHLRTVLALQVLRESAAVLAACINAPAPRRAGQSSDIHRTR